MFKNILNFGGGFVIKHKPKSYKGFFIIYKLKESRVIIHHLPSHRYFTNSFIFIFRSFQNIEAKQSLFRYESGEEGVLEKINPIAIHNWYLVNLINRLIQRAIYKMVMNVSSKNRDNRGKHLKILTTRSTCEITKVSKEDWRINHKQGTLEIIFLFRYYFSFMVSLQFHLVGF